MLRRFSGIVVLMLAASSAALAQFDYTPGFQPGAPEEVIVFEPMAGEWVVDLFYPAPDDTADAGWRYPGFFNQVILFHSGQVPQYLWCGNAGGLSQFGHCFRTITHGLA